MERLEHKTAIITGGASGIGRAIAVTFAREGADIIVADIQSESAQEVAEQVSRLGREALAIRTDVTNEAQVENLVKEALKRFQEIDILVNNAGTMGDRIGMPFTRNTPEDWDFLFSVNMKSVFLLTKAMAPHMMDRKKGKIINIASIAGQIGSQTSPPYSVTKAGVINFTQVLARDLAPYNINVNAICPGLLWTPLWEELARAIGKSNPAYARMTPREVFEDRVKALTPLQREQTPQDVAYLALFLASEESRNVTGQAMNVDGGIFMH
jgi:NAD(P)-dependent dehydrogenase (short-subunit alcohol dehydrogenase family)